MEQPKTVLVIEDDEEIRAFLKNAVLAPAGYRVLMALNGRQGLHLALTEQPDVILLDLMLPQIPGLELLQIMRERDCNIPTIILTAYGSEELILKAFRMGVRDFLEKPFGVDEVIPAIQKALREEHLKKEQERLAQALAQTNKRLQKQVQNWTTLNEIAQIVTSTLEETEIFQRVVKNITRILNVEACSLLLINQANKNLEFALTMEGDQAKYNDIQIEMGQGIAGWVAQHGRPLLVPDAQKDPRFFAGVDQYTGFHSQSIACVPLRAQGQIIGVLEAINKSADAEEPTFTREDLDLLTTLASWVTIAVQNAWLNRANKQMTAMSTLKQTITAMAHHINNRLMAFTLEMDGLEKTGPVSRETISALTASAHRSVNEISNVIKALERLEEIRTVPYAGKTEMLDIEAALKKELEENN